MSKHPEHISDDAQSIVDYTLGEIDGMHALIKSVLVEMVDRGDPALTVLRDTIREVEAEKDVRIR